MEKLINSIPKEWIYGKDTITGKEISHGFFLRYSSKLGWVCGYGHKTSPKYLNENYVVANDPVEAVADFVELLNKKVS